MEAKKLSLLEFFTLAELTTSIYLPPEIKLKISSYLLTCSHRCGEGRRLCCFCADKREEVRNYIDGKGWLKSKIYWKYYCPLCKKDVPGRKHRK